MELIYEDKQKMLLVSDYEVEDLICGILIDMFFRRLGLTVMEKKKFARAMHNFIDEYGDWEKLKKAFNDEIKEHYESEV